jgi:hypothetical protein
LRNTWADAVDDEVNTGTTDTGGDIQFGTTGFAIIVAEMEFSNPAFGAAAAGVITMASPPKTDASALAGTMAVFRIRDRDNVLILDGTVGTSGQDINFNSVIVSAGQTVELTSLTWTAAP